MNAFKISVIAAGALASAALGLAPLANAAPTDTSAAEVVSRLQGEGFNVILNKFGSQPLDQCAVSAIRPGQTYTRMDSGVAGAMDDPVLTVTARTVYVDVKC